MEWLLGQLATFVTVLNGCVDLVKKRLPFRAQNSSEPTRGSPEDVFRELNQANSSEPTSVSEDAAHALDMATYHENQPFPDVEMSRS